LISSDPFGIDAKRKRKAVGITGFFKEAKIPPFPQSSVLGKIIVPSCFI